MTEPINELDAREQAVSNIAGVFKAAGVTMPQDADFIAMALAAQKLPPEAVALMLFSLLMYVAPYQLNQMAGEVVAAQAVTP